VSTESGKVQTNGIICKKIFILIERMTLSSQLNQIKKNTYPEIGPDGAEEKTAAIGNSNAYSYYNDLITLS